MILNLRRSVAPRSALLGSAFTLLMPVAAYADCTFGGQIGPGGAQFHSFLASTSNAVTSAVTAMNTGFQTQTSAFLSSPTSTQPDQFGSGVWARAIGGRMDTNSNSTGTVNPPPAIRATFPANCSTQVRNDFTGVQGGWDVGSLNLGNSGWNAHFGLTGGYFETSATSQQGSGVTQSRVPFAGLYGSLINGGFFIDAQIVAQAYNVSVSEPSIAASGSMDGRGFGFTSSAGYNFKLGNGWFIEPSASVVYSKTSLDSLPLTLQVLGGPRSNIHVELPSSITMGDIETLPARLGVRVGTSFDVGGVAISPFATASVWHEFAGNTTANATFLPGLGRPIATAVNPGNFDISSTRIGTFGQYSLGMSAALRGTGWLGYARVDYRSGQNIDALNVNGGIRYQFAPAPQVAAAPQAPLYTKAPAPVAPPPFTWAGFYLGGFAGGAWAGSVTATELPGVGPAGFFNGIGNQSNFGLASSPIGGLDIGYNYQTGFFVAGLEAEGGYLSLSGSGPFAANAPTFASTKIGDWYTALTGRLGVAFGSVLIYGKGGAAIVDVTDGVVSGCLECALPRSVAAAGGNRLGVTWAAGAGLEYMIDNRWSLRGEYLALGTDVVSNTASGPGLVSGAHVPQTFSWRFDIPMLQTAKFGVNYRL